MDDKKRGLSLKTKIIITVFVIAAFFFLYLTYNTLRLLSSDNWGRNMTQNMTDLFIGEEGKVTAISQSELENVIKTAKLYTAEYPYNGYAVVRSDSGRPLYYVAYEGTVRAGINTEKIEIDLDEETSSIVIRLPYIEMEDPIIDAGTLEYIFTSEFHNTESVASEAYRAANVDLKTKALNDRNLRIVAENSAKSVIKALVEPWVNNTEKRYTVTVLAEKEELPEAETAPAKEGE